MFPDTKMSMLLIQYSLDLYKFTLLHMDNKKFKKVIFIFVKGIYGEYTKLEFALFVSNLPF